MNSMIENLVIDMRALGIRSLALELTDVPGQDVPPIVVTDQRDTEAPAPGDFPAELVEPEFAATNQCAAEGCGEPPTGILGGKMARFCRKHAFGKLGIK